MKTKFYAKKTLSVFLAVMMLMSCWVFVPGDHNHASAIPATTIASTNQAAIDGYKDILTANAIRPSTAGVYGSYSGDSGVEGNYSNAQRDTVYKNLIYAGQAGENTNNDPCAVRWNNPTLYKDGNYIRFHFPKTVMLYESGATQPSTSVVMSFNTTNANYITPYSGYIVNTSAGITLGEGRWHGFGTDGNGPEKPQFNYAYFGGEFTNGTGGLYTTSVGSSDTNGRYRHGKSGNKGYFWANRLVFTGTMGATEYTKEIKPELTWQGGNNNAEGFKTLTVTNSQDKKVNESIYVINIDPLKTAITAAFNKCAEVEANPAKYTTASVAKLRELAHALYDARPNAFITSTTAESAVADQVNAYKNAASAAVSNWNNWSGLEVQKYTITYKNYAGTNVKTVSQNYGTTANLADLAPANTAPASINDMEHQKYVWANTASITVTDDLTVNETPTAAERHDFDANNDGVDDYTSDANNHTLTCTVCGGKKTNAHVRNAGTVTTPETCTTDGVMTFDCSVCKRAAIATETINNIYGHDFSSGDFEVKVDGKDGSHWKKCSRCDTYGFNGVVDGHEAHDFDHNNDNKVDATDAETIKTATCTENGALKYTCELCAASYTETVNAIGHKNVVATPAKDVTTHCGQDGNVAYWTCGVCNKIYTDAACTTEITDYTDADNDKIPDVLETKGPEHQFTGAYVSVSGGVNGTHHRQCANFTQCKTYGPETPHNYNDGVVTKPATCEDEGVKTYTCADCNQTYTEVIAKVAHSMTKTDAVTPTCTTGGNNAYYTCSICKKVYKDEAGTQVTTEADEKLGALGHTFAAGNTDTQNPDTDKKISDATCQSPAIYQVTCDRCPAEAAGNNSTYTYGDVDTTVNGHKFDGAIKENADGTHSYKCTVAGCTEYGGGTGCTFTDVEETVASTCHTYGYTIYGCTTCKNTKKVDSTELNPANHDGETEVRGVVIADCDSQGYTGDTYCLGCKGKIADGEATDINPANHEDMKVYAAQEATCQAAGWKEYKYCVACGKYEIEKVDIEKKAHKFTNYVKNANADTHTATCDTCNAAVDTPATDTQACTGGTANCVDKAVCTVCNAAYGSVNAENHKTVQMIDKVDSTCQTEGTVAYRRCLACNNDVDTPEKIAKKAHIWGAWTKVEDEDKHTRSCTTCVDTEELDIATETADCTGGIANCVDKAVCTVCKAAYGAVNPANHKTQANHLDEASVIPATCQKKGFSGNFLYDCCGVVKTAGHETEMLAHAFEETARTAATCIAKGSVSYKCSTCVEADGEIATKTEELPIDANNHASEETILVKAKTATCEEDGYTGDLYHKCCYDANKTDAENRKALIEKGTVIKANGQHVYAAAVPEYMLVLDETTGMPVIETDTDGKKSFKLKETDPDYDGKIAARHDDNKWYHYEICTICYEVKTTACFTYEHTYNCVETDTCEICKGLCSLTDSTKHKNALTEDPGTAATCQTEGTKATYKCDECDKTFFDAAGTMEVTEENEAQLVIPLAAHDIDWENGEVTKEATCGTMGETTYKCKTEGCKHTITRADIPTTGEHDWKTGVVQEPTCGEIGYEATKCSNCGTVQQGSYKPIVATGKHTYKEIAKKEGSSCVDPTIITYECEVCKDTYTIESFEGVTGHQWGEWVTTGGDCSIGIIQVRTCTVENCGAQEQRVLNTEENHERMVKVRVEPTCEKDGYILWVCKNCGQEIEKEVLPVTGTAGHEINEAYYKTVSEATCKEAEMREYTCIHCGEKVVKAYGEMLDHVWLLQTAEIPTCDRDGHNDYYRCVRCLEERGRVNEPALGHADNDGDGKCDECNDALYEGGDNCNCLCHKEGWLMKLIYKIINFFWKLFKINNACACGAVHY